MKKRRVSRYERACNCRVLAIGPAGVELDIPATTMDEQLSYHRQAKLTFREFGGTAGVAILIDNDSGELSSTWSPTGLDERVMAHARRWLSSHFGAAFAQSWERTQRSAVEPTARKKPRGH